MGDTTRLSLSRGKTKYTCLSNSAIDGEVVPAPSTGSILDAISKGAVGLIPKWRNTKK